MYHKKSNCHRLSIQEQSSTLRDRYLNPNDIYLPPNYTIEVFAQGLDAPCCMAFNEEGDMFIGESGYVTKHPTILRLKDGQFEKYADGFEAPLTGLCHRNGDLYVSNLGKVTVVKPNGTKQDIIRGLPSYGDYWNSNITFGFDNKLYFGQGTTTNSGVVGTDNVWVEDFPCGCDCPGAYIMLNGQNYDTINVFSNRKEIISTGAFCPYGVSNIPHEVKKGVLKASGSILRANPDGTELELVAWGFRFPAYVKFDKSNHLYVSNQSYDVRGSRPIANAPDEFILVNPGQWYGWPDFAGGELITSARFKPEGGIQPELLLANYPSIPPRPFATFPANSYIGGFDFNTYPQFGVVGDVYIAEFGSGGRIAANDGTPSSGNGHRISKIDIRTGANTTFAMNKSGFSASLTQEGGLSRPVDIAFGQDGAMYVVDMGINSLTNFSYYYPHTGVIWKIRRM